MARILRDEWKPDPAIDPEPDAWLAIRSEKSVIMFSGPGSDKTEVLAQRASFLLQTGSTPRPKRILALCFKVDAVQNLQERVERRCGVDETRRFDCQTFHSFSKRLIDQFRLALPSKFRPPEDYALDRQAHGPDTLAFDDLLPLAMKVVQSTPTVKRAVQTTYSHVFLDEFQDCTAMQYGLISELFKGCGASITAVGDAKQSIMKFAGAVPEVFQRFQRDFGAVPRRLLINRRASPGLQRLQQVFVTILEPSLPRKVPSNVHANASILCTPSRRQEAVELCSIISGDIAKKHSVAVLCRSKPHAVSSLLQREFHAAGIKSREESRSQDVLSEPISRVIRAWLRLVTCGRDAASWKIVCDFAARVFGYLPEEGPRGHRYLRELNTALKKFRGDGKLQDESLQALRPAVNWLIQDFLTVARTKASIPQYSRGPRLLDLISETREIIRQTRSGCSNWTETLNTLDGTGCIRIMTIHKSKGLEFDTVVLLGLEDGFFSHNGEPDAELWELVFVAISRARNRLIVSRTAPPPGSDEVVRPIFDALCQGGALVTNRCEH